jgi:hypothetical protein
VETPRPARCARTAHLQEVGRAGTRRNDRQLVGAESAVKARKSDVYRAGRERGGG